MQFYSDPAKKRFDAKKYLSPLILCLAFLVISLFLGRIYLVVIALILFVPAFLISDFAFSYLFFDKHGLMLTVHPGYVQLESEEEVIKRLAWKDISCIVWEDFRAPWTHLCSSIPRLVFMSNMAMEANQIEGGVNKDNIEDLDIIAFNLSGLLPEDVDELLDYAHKLATEREVPTNIILEKETDNPEE